MHCVLNYLHLHISISIVRKWQLCNSISLFILLKETLNESNLKGHVSDDSYKQKHKDKNENADQEQEIRKGIRNEEMRWNESGVMQCRC